MTRILMVAVLIGLLMVVPAWAQPSTGVSPTTASLVFFAAGVLGAILKSYLSADQQTKSKKTLGDVILGGLTGILIPLLAPSLIPANANIVQQAALVAVGAYAGSDIIQNALMKVGITLPAAPKT